MNFANRFGDFGFVSICFRIAMYRYIGLGGGAAGGFHRKGGRVVVGVVVFGAVASNSLNEIILCNMCIVYTVYIYTYIISYI